MDLGKYRRQFRVALTKAGKAGEKVWVYKMGQDTVNPVALVKLPGWLAPYWMINREKYWENISGGRCPKGPDDVVLETSTIEEYDFQALDWSKTGYAKEAGDYGWLSPEGRFFPCDYAEHDDVAYYIIKKPVSELEKNGWVRVDGPGDNEGEHQGDFRSTFRYGDGNGEPNEVQAAWLRARGHNLDPYGLRALSALEREAGNYKDYVQLATETTGRPLKSRNHE